MATKRSELVAGIKAELPIAIGVMPFGLIYGVLATGAGLSPLLTLATSSIIFAGSAQFIGVPLLAAAAPVPVIWMTTFIVNIRHMLYSASLAPRVQHLSQPWRWLLAYLLTDEAYAPTIIHYDENEPNPYQHYFWLGAGVTLWLQWQLSTSAGILFGAIVPETWSLDFTLALTFIGMVVPALKDRPSVAAAVVGGVVAIIAHPLPYKLGLMVAALCGIAAGVLLENRSKQ